MVATTKIWVQVVGKSGEVRSHLDSRTCSHHHQSDGGSTADLLRHSTAPHPEPHDYRCRVSGIQESENPTTVHDSRLPTPHARNSRSQCASVRLVRLHASVLNNVQAESPRTRHEIAEDLQGFPLANELVPSYLIKRLQSIVSG